MASWCDLSESCLPDRWSDQKRIEMSVKQKSEVRVPNSKRGKSAFNPFTKNATTLTMYIH